MNLWMPSSGYIDIFIHESLSVLNSKLLGWRNHEFFNLHPEAASGRTPFPGLPLKTVHTRVMAITGSTGVVYSQGRLSVGRGRMFWSCVPSSQNIEWTVSSGLLNDKRTIPAAWWNSHSHVSPMDVHTTMALSVASLCNFRLEGL